MREWGWDGMGWSARVRGGSHASSLSPIHSFYYLKSYVEGTGVVHLAAGIV